MSDNDGKGEPDIQLVHIHLFSDWPLPFSNCFALIKPLPPQRGSKVARRTDDNPISPQSSE